MIGLGGFGDLEWRWKLGVSAIPAVLFFFMLFVIPRSPRWLVKKRRIDEASRYIHLEQLALSPQCGFSSNIVGNLIREDDQWRKLELIQKVAADVWRS